MYKPFLTILAIHKQGGPDMAQEVLFAILTLEHKLLNGK